MGKYFFQVPWESVMWYLPACHLRQELSFVNSSRVYHFQTLRKNTPTKEMKMPNHESQRQKREKHRKTNIKSLLKICNINLCLKSEIQIIYLHVLPPKFPRAVFLSEKNNKTWVDWANVAGLVIQSDLSVIVKVTRNQWLFVTSN